MLTFACGRPKVYGLAFNPASKPKRLKTGEGHRPWEEWEITAFRTRWETGTLERTAFEIALNTGQRGGDVVAMLWNHITSGDEISIAQEKTKERVCVPLSIDLKTALEAWRAAQETASASLTRKGKAVPITIRRAILTNTHGRKLGIDHFRHMMADAYRAAGLRSAEDDDSGTVKGITTHGLRYTAATILKELGCDDETIEAITGHRTAEMVRKYTKKKRQARLAVDRLKPATAAAETPREQKL